MERSIHKVNIGNLFDETVRAEMADLLCNDNIIIVTGVSTVGVIKESSDSCYDYSVFDIDAQWDEDEAAYDESKFRDGGICEEGDALDAMNHFLEMIDHED